MNNRCSVDPAFSHNLMSSEKNVRSVFENDPNITFSQGVELIGISEDADSVTISFKDDIGKVRTSKVLN